MGAAREKDQADFDLDRFIDMFDQAMVSRDPRVVDALRSLMMMVILTRPEVNATLAVDRQRGPLRRMYEDLGHMNSRIARIEEEIRQSQQKTASSTWAYSNSNPWDEFERYPNEKYSMKVAAEIDQKILDNLKIQSQPIKRHKP